MGSIGPIGGYLADRFGGRRIALAGSVILLGGALLLIPLPSEWSPLDVAWRLVVMGVGMGFFAGPNLSDIMGNTPRSAIATASAASSLARNLGFALGPALATIAWASGSYQLSGMRSGVGVAATVALVGTFLIGFVRGHGRQVASEAAFVEEQVSG